MTRDEWRASRGAANSTQPTGDRTPAGAPPSGAAGGGGNAPGGQEPFNEAEFRALVQSYPPTNEGVRAAYAAAKARWGNQTPELLEHPLRLDKFRFADGRVVDFIGGAGGPNPTHVWNYEGPGHGGGGGAAGSLGAMASGNWQAGMDPSYQFIKDEAQKALQSGAAARGTLLTGGFQKDMAKYMAGLASTEFGNIFNRNMSLADLGLRAAGGAASTGTSYAGNVANQATNQAQTSADLTTGRGNAQAAGTVGAGNAWQNTLGGLVNMAGQYIQNKNGRKGQGWEMDDVSRATFGV